MKQKSTKKTLHTKKSSMNEGFKIAFDYQKRAHAPYSQKQIGAAIQLSDGSFYGGCNVENASYGATVCAERVAVWKAVSEKTKIKISKVYVVSPAGSPPWPPCGMCRQVLSEFCSENTLVYTANPEGDSTTQKFAEIFPGAFKKEYLK